MADNFLLFTVIGVLAVFGALGGIPQLLQWIKPTPKLQVNGASIQRQSNDNYKYQVHLEAQNQTKWWRRNSDATEVTANYYVIDKDGIQCGTAQVALCQSLLAGARILKDAEAYHSLVPDGNPYSIIFHVTCQERAKAQKKIVYEAAPIVYA